MRWCISWNRWNWTTFPFLGKIQKSIAAEQRLFIVKILFNINKLSATSGCELTHGFIFHLHRQLNCQLKNVIIEFNSLQKCAFISSKTTPLMSLPLTVLLPMLPLQPPPLLSPTITITIKSICTKVIQKELFFWFSLKTAQN